MTRKRKQVRPNIKKRSVKRSKQSARIAKTRAPRYESLPAPQKDAYGRTANLVSDLRRGEGPYVGLLRKYHLGSRTARKHAGRNLLGGTRGKPVRASIEDALRTCTRLLSLQCLRYRQSTVCRVSNNPVSRSRK